MNPLKNCLIISAFTGVLFFSGCATVTRGTTEELIVQSDPTGAQVRLSNGMTGVTPATFKVPRKGDIIVVVTKDGYKPAEVVSKAEVSKTGAAGFAGNILIGGVVGGVADAVTGAALSHFPNPVKVTLTPLGEVAKIVQAETPPPATEKTPAAKEQPLPAEKPGS
jgi:hypothetical protein